jgi:hypothetical protein
MNSSGDKRRRVVAVISGIVVGAGVIAFAGIGYEHIVDTLGFYEWQRLDEPSRRTVPFLAGLVVVSSVASFSGFWLARIIWNHGRG